MTPITQLKPGEIFVFGSNLAGRHGAGAALDAMNRFGAAPGHSSGLTGQCYAIPTKDGNLKTLLLEKIQKYVAFFLTFAATRPELTFLVTPIGCGLAGYKPEQIAPMFRHAPTNVVLPPEFVQVLAAQMNDERDCV